LCQLDERVVKFSKFFITFSFYVFLNMFLNTSKNYVIKLAAQIIAIIRGAT